MIYSICLQLLKEKASSKKDKKGWFGGLFSSGKEEKSANKRIEGKHIIHW